MFESVNVATLSVDSGNLFRFEGPKKESDFLPAVVLRNGWFNLR